jgi:hypothetical protein
MTLARYSLEEFIGDMTNLVASEPDQVSSSIGRPA